MQPPVPVAVSRILVIRMSSIGDIILTTPLLRALKKAFPGATLTFIIKKQYAALLEGSPLVDELIAFDKSEGFHGLRKLKQQLKAQKFDLFLDIHGSLRSRYLRAGLGVRHGASYPKYLLRRYLLIFFRINLYKDITPVYLRYFETVKKMAVRYDGEGTEIHVPEAMLEEVGASLENLGRRSDTRMVVICPGATYSNKQWTTQGFIETARVLSALPGTLVVMHGGRDDVDLCKEIANRAGRGVISLAGQLSLPGSAALFRYSSVVIANDSGMLHLAQSQKTPVVGIYGPTTRELGFFPLPQRSHAVEVSLPCRPCTPKGLNHCPKKHFRCMNDITPDRVIEAVLSFLK
jgi:lipopolysaccharide heptosyltransferase II